ncbi:hypothetical protein KY289_013367 [Solanum tuberosum]|nr:hypothetical protein KY289_013367 [Solanum tuberosum]
MPFPVLISRMCNQAGIQYFESSKSILSRSVLVVNKKRDVEASKVNRTRMKEFGMGEGEPSKPEPGLVELGNASNEEEQAHSQPSPTSVSKECLPRVGGYHLPK